MLKKTPAEELDSEDPITQVVDEVAELIAERFTEQDAQLQTKARALFDGFAKSWREDALLELAAAANLRRAQRWQDRAGDLAALE